MTPAKLPERIGRLGELASNLWWSWQQPARELFRALDYSLWRLSGHNPMQQLNEINPDKLTSNNIWHFEDVGYSSPNLMLRRKPRKARSVKGRF